MSVRGLPAAAAGELVERLVERRARRRSGRRVVDRAARQLLEAEIRAGIEAHHVHALLQEGDEGRNSAVESAFVEPLRVHVRGRHHHDPVLEQGREEAAEDHRVGDVGDGELVEAQDPGLLREGLGDRADRIVALHLAGLERLAPGMDALVHVAMNAWKWTRRLRRTGSASKNRSISMVLPRPTEPQT